MTDQLVFSLLLGPECFWLVLQKVSRRNRIWREECEVLSIVLLLRVPQPCTGRAQKGCFWLAAGCLQAPVSLLWEVAGMEAVAWRHGLLYKDEGEAELVLAVVAAPSWTMLHLQLQPFASCPRGARPALRLHLPRFSQASVWLCIHPACSKDRNLHFSLHFWRTEILESLNHLACPQLCCLCSIPFI